MDFYNGDVMIFSLDKQRHKTNYLMQAEEWRRPFTENCPQKWWIDSIVVICLHGNIKMIIDDQWAVLEDIILRAQFSLGKIMSWDHSWGSLVEKLLHWHFYVWLWRLKSVQNQRFYWWSGFQTMSYRTINYILHL